MTRLEKAQLKHKQAVVAVARTGEQREKAARLFIRLTAKHDAAVKVVTRTSKFVDKVREEEKAERARRKAAKVEAVEPIAI